MKLKLFVILFLMFQSILFSQSEPKSTVLVPSNKGFVKHNMDTKYLTFNKITENLGYHKDQLYMYMNSEKVDKIWCIGLELFSNNIAFVAMNGSFDWLPNEYVINYLGNFKWKDEFPQYKIQSTLDDCVKNKAITIDFVSRIFNIKEYKGKSVLFIPALGYNLIFKNNVLVSYESTDGLSTYAKEWKESNYKVFRSYRNEAKKYWGNNEEAIINEINIQADAFANTPQGFRNEHIKIHTNSTGNVNFKMLMISHYNEKIILDEFQIINHNRYELMNEFTTNDGYKRKTYKVNNTFFTFSEYGILVNTYSIK